MTMRNYFDETDRDWILEALQKQLAGKKLRVDYCFTAQHDRNGFGLENCIVIGLAHEGREFIEEHDIYSVKELFEFIESL